MPAFCSSEAMKAGQEICGDEAEEIIVEQAPCFFHCLWQPLGLVVTPSSKALPPPIAIASPEPASDPLGKANCKAPNNDASSRLATHVHGGGAWGRYQGATWDRGVRNCWESLFKTS
jgi:hypothetical protein